MPNKDLWRLGAHDLSQLTRSGAVSPTEAVTAALARMDAVNPDLNAVVDDLRDAALARAEALDSQSPRQRGPLHGVPVTIKINIDQTGHATSNGVLALRDLIAPDDAPVVQNLERAGAVVIGRTNTPEFSFRADTDNPLHGRTHNPWGRHISAGGSSGGGGVAVMAGMGALAHGNDIGGSLRFPAAANGAVTVKPGFGRVPAWNPSQTAERGLMAQLMSVQGLMARQAADLHLSMPAMIAPDPRDPFHAPVPWQGAPAAGPVRVAFTRNTHGYDLHPEVEAALLDARDALTDAGYILEEVEPPDVFEIGRAGYRTLMGEIKTLMKPDIDAMGSETIRSLFQTYFAEFPPFEGDELLKMYAKRSHFARQWAMFIERYPLVLTPFQPQPFFAPDRDLEGVAGAHDVLGCAVYSYAMNFMGLPAACVPARLAQLPGGPQPINIQIVAQRWREDMAVDAAIAIEDRIGAMAPHLWAHMDRTH
ncbi:amidase family protein [Tritonibacter horizontis]|uniref:Acylamidase n=1 Tax=Tritonibacter horizontis TaxID=1768241 RepID=A0A132BSX9_9RHOB|nr:amidase family protein [Tritonibacter horizontis]KUP91316.1 acylamidase [Tritonibacter horizontis]